MHRMSRAKNLTKWQSWNPNAKTSVDFWLALNQVTQKWSTWLFYQSCAFLCMSKPKKENFVSIVKNLFSFQCWSSKYFFLQCPCLTLWGFLTMLVMLVATKMELVTQSKFSITCALYKGCNGLEIFEFQAQASDLLKNKNWAFGFWSSYSG